jgi:hypothetical protein
MVKLICSNDEHLTISGHQGQDQEGEDEEGRHSEIVDLRVCRRRSAADGDPLDGYLVSLKGQVKILQNFFFLRPPTKRLNKRECLT